MEMCLHIGEVVACVKWAGLSDQVAFIQMLLWLTYLWQLWKMNLLG